MVLLFDEFQVATSRQEGRNFLGALKVIQDQRSVVQAILGFGTFVLATAASPFPEGKASFKETYSPFPYEQAILIPPLPKDEINEMFASWEKDRNVKLERTILDHIFDLTNGYSFR